MAKLFVFYWRIRTACASSACEHRPFQPCNMYGLQTLNHVQRAPNHNENAIRNVILIAVHDALWSLKDVRTIYGVSIALKSRAASLSAKDSPLIPTSCQFGGERMTC